jgi:RNA binding exosome subunit
MVLSSIVNTARLIIKHLTEQLGSNQSTYILVNINATQKQDRVLFLRCTKYPKIHHDYKK